jgi:hypothetical protein
MVNEALGFITVLKHHFVMAYGGVVVKSRVLFVCVLVGGEYDSFTFHHKNFWPTLDKKLRDFETRCGRGNEEKVCSSCPAVTTLLSYPLY